MQTIGRAVGRILHVISRALMGVGGKNPSLMDPPPLDRQEYRP